MASEWEIESCVHGYHIYQSVWTTTLDDEFICARNSFNSIDRYEVAVKNDDTAVGHLPKKISRICSLFLWRGWRFFAQAAWPDPDIVLILLVTLWFIAVMDCTIDVQGGCLFAWNIDPKSWGKKICMQNKCL